jgi:membrane dipeptidase
VIDPEGRSLERLVDHVDHAVRVAGIGSVGLGGDFTRQIDRVTGPPQTDLLLLPAGAQLGDAIEGLEGPQDYGRLVDALRRRGYDGERLEAVLSGNLLSFLRRALPAG